MILVEDYINVKKRIESLGYNQPAAMAILPRNFEKASSRSELVYEGTSETIRKLWKQKGILDTRLEKEGEKTFFVIEESFEWIGPLILFTSTMITQNPQMVDLSIGVISNYLADWFKGITESEKKAKIDVIVEKKDGSYKKIHYEGPIEGLKELPGIARSIHDE